MPVQGTHEGTRGFQACIQTPRSLLLPYVPQMGTAHTPPKRASLPRAHLLCVRTPHTLPPSRQWASNQTSQSTETNPCMPIQATQSPLCVRHPAAGRLRILHSPHMHTTITQLSECRPFLHQLRHSPLRPTHRGLQLLRPPQPWNHQRWNQHQRCCSGKSVTTSSPLILML